MAYKSLLTVTTDEELDAAPLAQAIAMAQTGEAHLEAHCLGIDRSQNGYYYAGANALIYQENLQRAQEYSAAIEKTTKELLTGLAISWSIESGVAQLANLNRIVAHRARFSDLVILPKPYGNGRGQEAEVIVESAMFEGHAPVLVVPDGRQPNPAPKRIAVAWNESS